MYCFEKTQPTWLHESEFTKRGPSSLLQYAAYAAGPVDPAPEESMSHAIKCKQGPGIWEVQR